MFMLIYVSSTLNKSCLVLSCLHASLFVFNRIITKVACTKDRRNSLKWFDFGQNQTADLEVTWTRKKSLPKQLFIYFSDLACWLSMSDHVLCVLEKHAYMFSICFSQVPSICHWREFGPGIHEVYPSYICKLKLNILYVMETRNATAITYD